ncbi:MAG: RES domain-containing protein [Burkholderiaceae bacterium]|jgi:RES domain-containing protein|nr:RES domain-containing protein [Burkholderiaceae bacterium]
MICTYFVRGLRMADFSAGFDPRQWPPLWADFAVDWRTEWFGKHNEPPTWYMADDVIAARLDGILFPSQAHSGGTNLVIYQSSTLPPDRLRVHDPEGVLQTIAHPSGRPG